MEVQNQGYLAILVPNKEVIHIMRERKREREMKRERDEERERQKEKDGGNWLYM